MSVVDHGDSSQLVIKGKNGYLLVEETNSKLFLPFCKLNESLEDYKAAAEFCLKQVVCVDAEIKALVSIQHKTSNGQKRLTVTYYAEARGTLQEVPKVKTRWFTPEQVKQLPYLNIVKLIKKAETGLTTGTLSPAGLLESCESELKPGRTDSLGITHRPTLARGASLEDQVLAQAEYGEFELEQIRAMVAEICGSPDGHLTLEAFTTLMTGLGYSRDSCSECFRALQSSSEEKGLSVSELQLGLACLDPHTVHGNLCAQFRCQYIFKLYNKSGTERLCYADFQNMLREITRLKKKPVKDEEWETYAIDSWSTFGVSPEETLSVDEFLKIVGQLKFRGTSVLFRLPHSPVNRGGAQGKGLPEPPVSPVFKKKTFGNLEPIKDEPEDMDTTSGPATNQKPAPPRVTFGDNDDSMSDYSEPDDEITIATHFVKVRRSGAVSDVSTLWDLEGMDAVSGSIDSLDRPGFDRLPSINAFDKQSRSNEMLSGLRYFEHALKDNGRGQPKTAFSWGAVDMASVAKCFIELCAKAVDVFSSEPRLLDCTSPCYVLGDIHGNFHDLVCFEKVLWRMGPLLTPASFLFLGDYVDRGAHGFEVVAYLLAQKLLMPSKFLMIRGNHEIREVQETFSYKEECLSKFGQELGLEVWEATNSAFDCIPIAAVVDRKVFCVHGGIPFPWSGLEYITSINDIPSRLPNPLTQSQLAWDIMWNDPIRSDEIDQDIEVMLEQNHGFVENFARGTAHMFSTEALESFLKRNKLSHVIRAHECKAAGFQLQQRGRLLTVFSSSHYCGSSNEAACVLIDNKKIRTIRLDTT